MKNQLQFLGFTALMILLALTACEKEEEELKIGDFHAGGIVFYLDGNGGGLVCAEADFESKVEWGCYDTLIGGTSSAIGSGAANTAKIVAGCDQSGTAARICNDLVWEGYSDWFLPSKDELDLMYKNLHKKGIGDFKADYYWSSTEANHEKAWQIGFPIGMHGGFDKMDFLCYARPVRAFQE
jgi:hypothetical protein